ncbi:hypothetical protein NKI51_14020 [Mesorhizobium australicum]|uniref:hypothetical protein n=1 Tax=Mesorhizobium TaxID=68287 RepID=UPI0012EBD4D0|nr:hypothetical protein [Mesorhizobium sp. LNHC229A00]
MKKYSRSSLILFGPSSPSMPAAFANEKAAMPRVESARRMKQTSMATGSAG